MFNSDISIIIGERQCGKTTFLEKFDDLYSDNNHQLCLFTINKLNLEKYRNKKDSNIYSSLTACIQSNYHNLRKIRNLQSILYVKKFDYLIIDDFEFLSQELMFDIFQMNIKKILTCSSLPSYLINSSIDYKLYPIVNSGSLIKQYKRNEKINFILND